MMSEKVQELFARLEGMDVEMVSFLVFRCLCEHLDVRFCCRTQTLSIERLGYSFAGMAFRQLVRSLHL